MKDIELPPLPKPSMFAEYWASDMHAYARAAVEADRAQRVPDGWANLLKAAREVLSWTQAADRPPVRDEIECGRMTGVRVHALADLHEAVQVLASTPAPAQQEPAMQKLVELSEDLGLYDQTPQQERKPMTSAQRERLFIDAERAMAQDINLSWRHAIVEAVERHHGIKE